MPRGAECDRLVPSEHAQGQRGAEGEPADARPVAYEQVGGEHDEHDAGVVFGENGRPSEQAGERGASR